jgi:hypothetical protein
MTDADSNMTHAQFTRLLQTYGAVLERWPEPERQYGAALLAESAQLRAQWESAASLEALFAADSRVLAAAATDPAAIVRSVMRRLPSRSEPLNWRWLLGRGPAFAMALMIIIGFIVGLTVTPEGQRQQRHSLPLVTALLSYDLLAGEVALP